MDINKKSNKEKRDNLYDTLKCVPWENRLLTINEATNLWIDYYSKLNSKSLDISNLIVEQKNIIREQYPDE